jgi:hypothetical protein
MADRSGDRLKPNPPSGETLRKQRPFRAGSIRGEFVQVVLQSHEKSNVQPRACIWPERRVQIGGIIKKFAAQVQAPRFLLR